LSQEDFATIKRQLQQLRELHDSGAIATDHYDASRKPLEQRLVEQVLRGESTAEAAAPVPAATPAKASEPKARASTMLAVASLAFVTLVAIVGYAWKGSPTLVGLKPGEVPVAGSQGGAESPESAAGGKHTLDAAQIEAMVGKLRERLVEEPGNAQGWGMLARSYSVLGKPTEAVAAYEKAIALTPDDAAMLADYADSLALRNGRKLDGEPAKLIERALKIDPDQPKALALAGTAAFDRRDYAGAAKAWERVLATNPDHPFAPQLRDSVNEARQLAGMPALPAAAASGSTLAAAAAAVTAKTAAAATASAQSKPSAAADDAQVSGRVSLAAALAAKAAPEDTVFVFARAAEGPRMPLAIVRKQVKDLPFDFKLDDSMGMTPQMKLSAFPKVVIGARVSKGGDAVPRAGDLQGQSKPVEIGTKGIDLVIVDVVAN
jgi:cytochrome c-type biogenesis protein CcmH